MIAAFSGTIFANPLGINSPAIITVRIAARVEIKRPFLIKSFEKIRVKRDENKNLVLLRDSLLPKLMSGEIRVPLDEEGDVS